MISYSSATDKLPSVELICSPLPAGAGLLSVMAAMEYAAPRAASNPIVCTK